MPNFKSQKHTTGVTVVASPKIDRGKWVVWSAAVLVMFPHKGWFFRATPRQLVQNLCVLPYYVELQL